MPELSKNYTVIAVDMRGAGEASLTDSGYDKKTLAEDIYLLMQKLSFKKALVVSHDWGAAVAYAYAALHPEAVSKLVIAEGGPFEKWMPKIELYWYLVSCAFPATMLRK